jgi:C-terminal processing protease CtpA/Prc
VGTLRVDVADGRRSRVVTIARTAAAAGASAPVLHRRIGEQRDLGYLRIKGEVADARVAPALAAALAELRETRALVVDLRDANGDGAPAAIERILSHFADAPTPWRVRIDAAGRRHHDTVAPSAQARYRQPVVVLVDRWTAGDGEALAAGLVAVARAQLVGTPMAGLRGALADVELPHSGVKVRFPSERVLHVDGTPREEMRPAILVDLAAPAGGPGDPILYQALRSLEPR